MIGDSKVSYPIEDGNGEITNDFKILSYMEGTLEEVDSWNNSIVYSEDITGSTGFYGFSNSNELSGERKEAILESELQLSINENKIAISFLADEVNALNTVNDFNRNLVTLVIRGEKIYISNTDVK